MQYKCRCSSEEERLTVDQDTQVRVLAVVLFISLPIAVNVLTNPCGIYGSDTNQRRTTMRAMPAAHTVGHLPDVTLLAYLEKAIPARNEQVIVEHLRICPNCKQQLKGLYVVMTAFEDLSWSNGSKRRAAENKCCCAIDID
jgi:threonine dehydrogenase-like Zn-dependent dehydrogenase